MVVMSEGNAYFHLSTRALRIHPVQMLKKISTGAQQKWTRVETMFLVNGEIATQIVLQVNAR